MSTARNIAIVLAIAAAIEFLPGGGDVADLVSRALSAAFIGVFVLGGVFLYRRFRLDLEQLSTGYRALLYGAIGVLVLALAASSRLTNTSSGALVFVALLAGVAGALLVVWRRYRSLA